MNSLVPFINRTQNMFGHIEQMFKNMWDSNFLDRYNKALYPKINAFEEKDNRYVVEASVPGYSKNEVKVEFNEDEKTLTISAFKKTKRERIEQHLHEIRESSFERMVRLPDRVYGEPLSSEIKNGILRIEWQMKPQKSKVKTLEIK